MADCFWCSFVRGCTALAQEHLAATEAGTGAQTAPRKGWWPVATAPGRQAKCGSAAKSCAAAMCCIENGDGWCGRGKALYGGRPLAADGRRQGASGSRCAGQNRHGPSTCSHEVLRGGVIAGGHCIRPRGVCFAQPAQGCGIIYASDSALSACSANSWGECA